MKKATAAKLDKWFRAHAPSFVALGAPPPKIDFPRRPIPFNDLMQQFRKKMMADDPRGAELILKKLSTEFGVSKSPQGKLERDVEKALLYLPEELGRNPSELEIFQMVHAWDNRYTRMGVHKVIQRRGLDFLISPRKRGRPKKIL